MFNLEQHNKLFSSECKFIIGATKVTDIPPTEFPEFAFVGKSNVGKSSLINALVNRNSLARTSQTPGCTRQVNFFNLGEKLNLVDLPGYGYAKRGKAEKASWGQLIHQYLRGRRQLRIAFLLMDSRHEVRPDDIDTMKYLDDHATLYQIILTKADKASASDIEKKIAKLKSLIKKHPACFPDVIACSSVSKDGIDLLRERVIELMR